MFEPMTLPMASAGAPAKRRLQRDQQFRRRGAEADDRQADDHGRQMKPPRQRHRAADQNLAAKEQKHQPDREHQVDHARTPPGTVSSLDRCRGRLCNPARDDFPDHDTPRGACRPGQPFGRRSGTIVTIPGKAQSSASARSWISTKGTTPR